MEIAKYCLQEERLSMLKRLEGLVREGKLEQATYDKVKALTGDPHCCIGVEVLPGKYQDLPTEMHNKHEEYVYAYKPGDKVPSPDEIERLRPFTAHADMGPGRYAPAGASIFALNQCAEMADAPLKMSAAQTARLAKATAAQQAIVESPTFFGYRVLPRTMTPGRTFFLGSMLAVWGTAALVGVAVKEMGFGSRQEVQDQGTRAMSPLAQRMANWFMPWREKVQAPREASEPSEFVGRLRESVSK
ncbi:hypothetical protein N2152v2_003964 [Parachlorella kessleri]